MLIRDTGMLKSSLIPALDLVIKNDNRIRGFA